MMPYAIWHKQLRVMVISENLPETFVSGHYFGMLHCTRKSTIVVTPTQTFVGIIMAARRLIPLLDRVLVQKVEAVTKSASGILLPESAAAKVNEGVVLAVGPGRRTKDGDMIPVSVKEGDKVLLPEYGGSQLKLGQENGKELYLYRDEEILGILKD